jgi:hypothetical protein
MLSESNIIQPLAAVVEFIAPIEKADPDPVFLQRHVPPTTVPAVQPVGSVVLVPVPKSSV